MPFTLAHTAAVLPFIRQPVVPLALVAGAMAPDLPYFVFMKPSNGSWPAALLDGISSHQFTHILTVGLPLAVVLAGFLALVSKPLRWALPESWVSDTSVRRMRAPDRTHQVLWAFHSLLLGLLTHLIWDSFTHSTGWAVQRFPLLGHELIGTMPVFRVAQHASTLAGLTILALWYLKRRGSTGRLTRICLPREKKVRTIFLAFLLLGPAAAGAVLGLGAAPAIEDAASAELFLQTMILRGGAALMVALAIYGIAWHVVDLVRKSPIMATTSA